MKEQVSLSCRLPFDSLIASVSLFRLLFNYSKHRTSYLSINHWQGRTRKCVQLCLNTFYQDFWFQVRKSSERKYSQTCHIFSEETGTWQFVNQSIISISTKNIYVSLIEVYVLWQRKTKSFKTYRPSFCTARMAKGSGFFFPALLQTSHQSGPLCATQTAFFAKQI